MTEILLFILLIAFIAAAGVIIMLLMRRDAARRAEEMRREAERHTEEMRREADRRAEEMRREADRRAEEMRRETADSFKALAADLLKAQTESLRTDNARQMEALLGPLSQNLADFRKVVSDCYVQESASRRSLTDQIEQLMRLNQSIGAEARNLTLALKGNSKVQGDWGEMVLTTLLEEAGLEEGIHFEAQPTRDDDGNLLRDTEGRNRRPDVVVKLPEGRRIIIDSKVSLTAYADVCAEPDDALKGARMKAHTASVRKHVEELASKEYQNLIKGSADYVMMFIPNEGAYITAVQADPALWQYAFTKGVAIVSPTHLFSVMQLISQLWLQDKQNRHTLEIAKKGGLLYDKVMLFMQAFEDVGAHLDKAGKSFNTAMDRLATGRGNVARLSRDLRELGVKASRTMPPLTRERLESGENDMLPSLDETGSVEHETE